LAGAAIAAPARFVMRYGGRTLVLLVLAGATPLRLRMGSM